MKEILAVDIGGTSSRFAWFEVGETQKLVESIWLKTGSVTSFGELLEQLEESDFSQRPADADIVVLAIAGPVQGGLRVTPPNIAWGIDLSNSQIDYGFSSFALVNDFLAQAYACVTQIGRDARVIIPGIAAAGSGIAVVGAGTGLGKACLIPDLRGGYLARPSEGGHAALAIEREEEFELLRFMLDKSEYKYVSWEEVVSGRGISQLHEFLTGDKLAPAEVAATFSDSSQTLEWAARFYGRVCRNYVLDTLSLGGLFIAGGVAVKNPALIDHPSFCEALHYGRAHSSLLESLPVHLVESEESGLWGAAYYGMLELNARGHVG